MHVQNEIAGIEQIIVVGEPQVGKAGIFHNAKNDEVVDINKITEGSDDDNNVKEPVGLVFIHMDEMLVLFIWVPASNHPNVKIIPELSNFIYTAGVYYT